ncbi:hypothetical protein OROMI_000381 [Orobanche minor]
MKRFLGSGSETSFWEHTWCGDRPLRECFPRLYQLCATKDSKVSESGRWEGSRRSWEFRWRRELRERELAAVSELKHSIQATEPRRDVMDSWRWTKEPDGKYSVRSTCLTFDSITPAPDVLPTATRALLWKICAPFKVQSMAWRTFRNKLPTRDNLCKRIEVSMEGLLELVSKMSDNGSVPSPLMKDSDHLFGPSEIGPKFAYEAGIRRKIISNNDMFPEWAGHVRRLRVCELEEGGSLCNHILEMMNYMNKLEYLDTNFDRNLAVPLLLRSLPDSYNDFLWKNHCENKSKTWIEIINELRRYEEDKITQKGKLEEEKGKEKEKRMGRENA